MRLGFLVILLTIFCCEVLLGQIDTYPLSEYKRPVLRRSTYTIDANMSSDNEFNSNDENDKSSMRLDLDMYYSKFENDRTTQSNLYHLTRIDTDVDFINDKKFGSRINHTSRYQVKYFQLDNRFIGYTPEIQLVSDFGSVYDSPNRTIATSLPVGIGKGRVEYVNDAWLATSILQALKDAGKLNREPSHSEITYFAEEIGRIKNARVLDFRTKRIYELDEIYKYILQLGLVQENTLAFAVLYDAWLYENFSVRQSGEVLETYFSPTYYLRIGEDKFDDFRSAWNVEYRKYKPINLKWETSLRVYFEFNSRFINHPFANKKFDQLKDNLQGLLGGSYTVNYFLSRRSNFRLYNSFSYSKNLKSKYNRTSIYNSFDLVHWLTPQLQLQTGIGITSRLISSGFYKDNRVRPRFNFEILYALF